ncbi:trypsin-like peptidase domain-containing protein [Mycobacteroides franklinii]|uniref:Trypsin-like peptidase domain-containing protein n=1 Tax=Mycobacteroides franklinii TaxID=948102 RepID=A0A4V6QEP5_9MYCO|nr:trypsin-like peptidase domain-containing protein [Mycobacteroides franklinii]TDZ41638.1 hypothetical protein CCUG64054_01668 [Mycobacteroides franklinii]TDZ47063.1 hypothetical protein CCUG63697_04839 [Mycobacteroides franklinii]TDZ55192.1 hypothetical protein CCUG63696_01670 [Mycobacteroides franklinii]TDZ62133.1 hypothetical protein CCUG63695_01594 [Mycobacteroides franklinii]TDZ68531.1 hypothetical protein CCUG64056_01668 [Mycobacteroides franklinii]
MASQPASVHKGTIPRESFRSTLIEMVYRGDGADPPETVQATGSAFFYKVGNDYFLITARHNFTGWDDVNEVPLSSRGVGPTHIRIGFWPPQPSGGYQLTEPLSINLFQMPLFEEPDGEGVRAARWLEHPSYGQKVDVAAMKIRLPESPDVLCLPWDSGSPDIAYSNTKLWVTQNVSIVGYPYGLNNNNLPVWVRGSIATEPELLYVNDQGEGLPLFLVDARTRKGQSGSPVMLFRHPGEVVATGPNSAGVTHGTQSKLLGVYSGRVNRDSDLGYVWRVGIVDEICRREQRSSFRA